MRQILAGVFIFRVKSTTIQLFSSLCCLPVMRLHQQTVSPMIPAQLTRHPCVFLGLCSYMLFYLLDFLLSKPDSLGKQMIPRTFARL